MPLSSSYHDCGGLLLNSNHQRSAPPRSLAPSAPTATSTVVPTRSPVQFVGRESTYLRYKQRQASPETTGGMSMVALNTASVALHREQEALRPLAVSPLQLVPEGRPVLMSTQHQQPPPQLPHPQEKQRPQRALTAVDGRSSVASSRAPRQSAHPVPSHLNPSFQAIVSRTRSTERRSATPSMSLARETAVSLDALPQMTSSSTFGPASSTSPRLIHIRPLNTSLEADYLNFAYRRGFMGRFRCAIPVVVRTPVTETLHEHFPRGAVEQAAAKGVSTQEDKSTEEADDRVGVRGLKVSEEIADAAEQMASPVADDHEHRPHAEALRGSALLSRPRLSMARSAASVASGSTTRRGRVGERVNSKPLSPFASASVTASSVPRRRLRPTPTFTGLRRSSVGTSSAVTGGGVPADNMAPLTHSGLHTSLWMATQDGCIEVRSMANPNDVLASAPRKDARTVITELEEICGNRVVAGYTDGSLRLFDASTLKIIGEHQPHTAAVTKLLYVEAAPPVLVATNVDEQRAKVSHGAQMSSLLLTASLDRTITVWSAAPMTLLHRLKGSLRGVCALAATSTGGFAFSGSDDGTIRMWDIVKGQQWRMTKDERAELGRRRHEEALGGRGSRGCTVAVAGRLSPQDYKEHNESSDISDSDSEDDNDNGVGESRHGRSSPPEHASPHPQKTLQQQQPVRHLRPPLTSNSTDNGLSPCRSLAGCGKVKVVPLKKGTLIRGTLMLQQTGSQGRDRSNNSSIHVAVSHPSSRSLPATEGTFAPTDTAASFSPFRGDNILVGPGGGISPLRGAALDYEVERYGAENDAVPVHTLDYGYSVRVHSRKHHVTPTKAKKTRKAGEESVGGVSGAWKGKRSGGGEPVGTGKRKKIKRAKKVSAAVAAGALTATFLGTAASRAPSSVLEQRLETWLRLYQQRVLFSAASHQLTSRFAAGYDAVSAMNWPIEFAHIEYITALAVVEDRLLISASCDATAKVFSLPSGEYMRTLASSRRMPLSDVLYDSSVGRVYTGFSDGAVSVYDLTSPELPLLTQLQSPQTILSCTFASLVTAPLHRFVITRMAETVEGKEGNGNVDSSKTTSSTHDQDTTVVTTIAQFDKTTQAHGPNQTTSSYRVGQPSLRELNAAVSIQLLQQQRVASMLALTKRNAAGTLEERELCDKRQCGLVLAQAYLHRQTERIFFRWQWWSRRHALLRQFVHLAAARASSVAQRLLGLYMQRWVNAIQQRKKASAGAVLRSVQLKGSDTTMLCVPAAVRFGLQSILRKMATSMAASLERLTLRRCYHRWREFHRIRYAELKQSVGFNTLLLSMNSSTNTPACRTLMLLTYAATRRAHHAKALWLLTELNDRWQLQQQRRHCFDQWRLFVEQRQRLRVRLEQGAWGLVEPLSSKLVQPQLLRRRYFEVWRNFALYVARSGQLTSEREILQGEWAMLQRALSTPTTVAELKRMLTETEAKTSKAADERVVLAERVQALANEDSTLRAEEAMRVIIGGYYMPDAPTTVNAVLAASNMVTGTTTPRGSHAAVTREALDMRRTPVVSSSVESGVGRMRLKSFSSGVTSFIGHTEDDDFAEEDQRDRKLFVEVSAVLRALKGNSVQCARDDRLLANAYALALRLPIFEPLLNDMPSSGESTPSRRSSMVQPPQRSTTWSVSSARNGISTAVACPPLSASIHQQQQQCRRYSMLSGSVSSDGPAINAPGKGTPTTGSTSSSINNGNKNNAARASEAQMWASQPAEENYPSLADAFNTIYADLLGLLYGTAREYGVAANAVSCSASASVERRGRRSVHEGRQGKEKGATSANVVEEEDSNIFDELQVPSMTPSWLAQIPLKQRRMMVGKMLKLVTLFDSFAAHSDLPVERAGSISTRGAASTRALPLWSLCSNETAHSLLRHAAVLLELVDPQLWPRQLKLNYLQDAYAAAIAELNATVSSSHLSDGPQHSSTVMASSESKGHDTSSLPALLVTRPPALCLSAEVLQQATDTLPPATTAVRTPGQGLPPSQLDARTSATATTGASDKQPTLRSLPKSFTFAAEGLARTENGGSGNTPTHSTLLLSNLDPFLTNRSCGDSEEKLNDTVKSTEEEGQTPTPDPHHARSSSFSHHTFSAVSTPRSYAPRTATSSVAGTSTSLTKPYLGFRVNVTRESHSVRRAATTITIRDVVSQYINAGGVEVSGPALVAGLQAGDQLIRFAGYAVTDLAAFNAIVSRHVHSGAELPVVVQRGEELLSTTIVVGSRVV